MPLLDKNLVNSNLVSKTKWIFGMKIYVLLYISFFLITNLNTEVYASDNVLLPKKSINRLQYGYIDNKEHWQSASTFNLYDNNFFVLGLFQANTNTQGSTAGQADVYMGKPFEINNFEGEYGWVGRSQWFEGYQVEYSAGAQVSPVAIYKNKYKGELWAKWILGTTSFIQLLPVKNRDDLTGQFDINHRFVIPILPKGWDIRGFNRFHYFKSQENIFQTSVDLIKEVNPYADVYLRYSWINTYSEIYGNAGSFWSIGVRLNYIN